MAYKSPLLFQRFQGKSLRPISILMAASPSLCFCFHLLLLFPLLLVQKPSPASARRPAGKHYVVYVDSLLPSSSCSIPNSVSNTKAARTSKLKVVHRHGPCSPPGHQAEPSHVNLLSEDQSRVDSIHRLNPVTGSLSSTLPASTGKALGTGNYVVTIGLGTPKKDFTVVFDTGSDLSWTQCLPCVDCYTQQDPTYDPSQSSTYTTIPCSSTYCDELPDSTCSNSSTCMYDVLYGDNSHTQGNLVSDTLTVSSDSIPNFRYGCGNNNTGLFGKSDGLLGLGRRPESLVSQTAQRYGKVFSYCLPSRSSNAGYLELGSGTNTGVQYTTILTNANMPSFYFLKLVGIAVGGTRLAISPSVFMAAGTILDSGTVITRLPPATYTALRDRFKQLTANYTKAPALSILDTCYDFTGYKIVKVPTVGLVFDGGLTVNIDFSGIIYVASISQACLAFAGNSDPNDVAIIGNVQQRTLTVVYDGANLRAGFGANGCS